MHPRTCHPSSRSSSVALRSRVSSSSSLSVASTGMDPFAAPGAVALEGMPNGQTLQSEVQSEMQAEAQHQVVQRETKSRPLRRPARLALSRPAPAPSHGHGLGRSTSKPARQFPVTIRGLVESTLDEADSERASPVSPTKEGEGLMRERGQWKRRWIWLIVCIRQGSCPTRPSPPFSLHRPEMTTDGSRFLTIQLVAILASPTTSIPSQSRFSSDHVDPFAFSAATASQRAYGLLASVVETSGAGTVLSCLPRRPVREGLGLVGGGGGRGGEVGGEGGEGEAVRIGREGPELRDKEAEEESSIKTTARAMCRARDVWAILFGEAEVDRALTVEGWRQRGVEEGMRKGGKKRGLAAVGTGKSVGVGAMGEKAAGGERVGGKGELGANAWDLLKLLVTAWEADSASLDVDGRKWSANLARQFEQDGTGATAVEKKVLVGVLQPWREEGGEGAKGNVVVDGEERKRVAIRLIFLVRPFLCSLKASGLTRGRSLRTWRLRERSTRTGSRGRWP